jgi:hypothetical protein
MGKIIMQSSFLVRIFNLDLFLFTIFSFLVSLFFFLCGDVLLLYKSLFIFGLLSFLIGRILMILAFSLKPYYKDSFKIALRWRFWYLFSLIIFGACAYFCYLFEVHMINNKKSILFLISVPIYIFFCAFQASCSFFRFSVKQQIRESFSSVFFAFIGAILIGVSDGFIGYTM